MLTFERSSWIKRCVVPLLALAVLLVAGSAQAYGRVQWSKKTLKERTSSKSWKIEIKIFLPRAPDVAHVPMKFEFTPVAYYERSRVDGETKAGKVVDRRVPLQHRQALIESVDVGFLDPGTGKTEKRTRFSFKVTRAHGFEAGEYKVKIRDNRGRTVGVPTKLIFKGENEIIDRRTISFVPGEGKKKKKKSQMKRVDKHGEIKDENEPDEEGGGEGTFHGIDPDDEAEDEAAASDEGGGGGGEDSVDDEDIGDEADGPPPIKEKPGGCGCRVQDRGTAGASVLPVVAAFALLAFRRRRRAAA